MPRARGNDQYGTERIICPFFHSMKGQTISCEGFCAGCRSSTTFATKKKYDAHKKTYCESWSYEDCPVSGMISHAKYRQ